VCAAKARRELGKQIDWVYERFATFQSLGRRFQKGGAVWILETNGLLYKEAKFDHACLVLSPVARVLELRAYRQCDVLVCISRTLKKLICDEAGISPHKVLVIPNGVDVQWLDPDKHHPKHLFNGKDLTIGYVGRLTEWQALDLLFRAIYELKADKGLTINLMIAGDGRMKNTWSKMVSDLGLLEQVIFLGQVSSDLIPCYISGIDLGYSGQVPLKSADMYHSPLKIYEYMAMAKPVLASAFDDARSAVHPGKTGFLFESQNKDDLKRALTDAWNLRQQLPQMGWSARQEVVTHHSWRTRVASLAAGIDSILENHNGNPATL
jgi:glycosyltransferase involved in cell wall biosynthesis